MGPPEDCTRQPQRQKRGGGRKRPARRPRTRPCLLKGCERPFRPLRATERYCSRECREPTGKWRRWKAQQRYRATAAGREKRNGQSRRYRERVRKRKQTKPEEALPEAARVIPPNFFDHCCDRPGCYQGFAEQPRSPAQRFCSRTCRRAMERVRQRERRWRRALQQQWNK
jgi:predicted nucleic acid-binding Zn ribbon protein